jgi:hypothetical protein
MSEESVMLLQVNMLPEGFSIQVSSLLELPEADFVRNALTQMLPVIAQQIKNPTKGAEFEFESGDAIGTMYMINENYNLRKPN